MKPASEMTNAELQFYVADLERRSADQAARLKWISEACAAMLSANISPEMPADFDPEFIRQGGEQSGDTAPRYPGYGMAVVIDPTPTRAPGPRPIPAPRPSPAAQFDEDVFSALRCLGCHPHEAKRLAGIAKGNTPQERLADAMRRR